ncbi:hypothetical protein [Gemmiger formicilis]|uniref:hypothetical protein n=1 Tax=Gemmiger formicilis TaxID=745368 RepID=UPI00351FE920
MATYYNLFYYIIRLFSVSFRGKIVSFSRKPRFSACARSVFLLQLRQQGGGTVNTQKRNLCAAGVLLTAAATMVVLFLFRLSQPDKAQQSIFLNCTASDRGGWTFYTEAGQTEPVFGFGGYIDGVPAEGAGPVVAERIMEEPGERCFLQFSCVNAGLQVFLEDILLYTDFPQQENRVDVFLQNADFAGINYNGLCIPLPLDCAGESTSHCHLRAVPKRAARTCVSLTGKPFFRCRGADHRRCLVYDRRDGKAYVGAKPAFGAGAWCSGRTAAVEAIALEWILFIGGSVRRLQHLSGKCFGAECRQWSAELGLPDPHGLSVHLLGSRTSGQKTLGLGCHSPAAYSAYCLAEFCGGAASHRKSL